MIDKVIGALLGFGVASAVSSKKYAKGGSVSGTLKHNENIYVQELEKENYVNLEKLQDDLEATDLPLLMYYIEGNISQSELYRVRKLIVNQNATAEIGYFDGIKAAKEDKVWANNMEKEGKTPFQETVISINVVDRSKNRFKFRYIVNELNKIFGKRTDGLQLWKDGQEISGWFAKGGEAGSESIKGRNNKTGESYGVVIGSKLPSDDELEGGKKVNVRVGYGSRISEYQLLFDTDGNIVTITDFGSSLEGYPDTSGGSAKNYFDHSRKETLAVLGERFNPSFAKKLVAYIN